MRTRGGVVPPCGYSDGARISHTLRQDIVQREEGKRCNQTVETRAVTS